ncbi:uncharacterized protein LOC124924221 [Impatiens glandulifera]|uniref:uncharacterized protein LOC124924221 n=1 Tax=Impatiens glandulifera TaxID=253017 RepID=UPI001FB0EAEC|nr:uncharacterized protein LOC124924221 [Impatiens glandulifera]
MEKSRSFPQYSSSVAGGEFGFQGRPAGNSCSSSYVFNGPTTKSGGQLGFAGNGSDSELKRKKRIASYNMFTTEGKLKSSLRDSFKWIKNKFSDVRYGL